MEVVPILRLTSYYSIWVLRLHQICHDLHQSLYVVSWRKVFAVFQVIFADGTFIDGSTSELSCDGPLREPFAVYCQVCACFFFWLCFLPCFFIRGFLWNHQWLVIWCIMQFFYPEFFLLLWFPIAGWHPLDSVGTRSRRGFKLYLK